MDIEDVPEKIKNQILLDFYQQVCEMAEHKMLTTGKLEGAHYASMKQLLSEKGII